MSEGSEGRTKRTGSIWRRAVPLGVGGLAAVALVVVMMGTASAAPVVGTTATVTYKSPYSGNAFGFAGSEPLGCGSSATVTIFPSFNLTNGLATGSGKASSKSCGAGNSSEGLEMGAEYLGPEFTTTSGSHNVSAIWSADFSVNLASTGTASHGAQAGFEVFAFESVNDVTNGTTHTSLGSFAVFDEITSGTYSHTYKVSVKSWVVSTFKASHTYSFEVELETYVFSNVAPGGGTASASLTEKAGCVLKSVAVS
jgi:hypothetical protein